MSLAAGTGRKDITPAVGSLMAAFPHQPGRKPRRAEGVHDRLMARALCLSDGCTTLAIVAADVLFFDRVDVDRIRRTVGKSIPQLNGPNLILAASHTHSGPETCYLFGNTPDDPYITELIDRIAAAVIEAHATMQPVHLRGARGRAALAHNRRVQRPDGKWTMMFDHDPNVTTGPRDDDLPVIRIDPEDGPPLAVFYNFAAHALTIGPQSLLYTADFPGVSSAAVEARYPGSTALFLNGAAGNQHPRQSMTRDFAVTERIGRALADRVIAIAEDAELAQDDSLAIVSDTLSFANHMSEGLSVDVELSCVRLGPFVFAIVPGEPFVELQLAFKRAVASKLALFVGYANSTCGYMPTRAACQEGGYGAEPFLGDPPGRERTALPPGAGETIVGRLIEMTGSLQA